MNKAVHVINWVHTWERDNEEHQNEDESSGDEEEERE